MQEMVNWYATRRHYVGQETDPKRSINQYVSLCGRAYGDGFERHAKRVQGYGGRPVEYAALPLCRFCERIAARADA